MSTKLKSTDVGYENRNRQVVISKIAAPIGDRGRGIYVLRCLNPECLHEYGSAGADIARRKCPRCQGGPPDAAARRTSSQILDAVADLYEECDDAPFSGRDHDRILYGDRG